MAAFSPTLDPLLAIKGLNTRFKTPRGSVRAVTDVDLTLGSGEILGLVGESGSGKSALALSILRLIEPPGEIAGGEILFEGRNVLEMASRELREPGAASASFFSNPRAASIQCIAWAGMWRTF